MKTSELLSMLKTAEQLGIKDIPILKCDSRDGNSSYTKVKCKFSVITGPNNQEDHVLLIV